METVGIFLGRMQPLHDGHRWLIRKVFEENSEVIICIGSAQEIGPDDAKAGRNPLAFDTRAQRVAEFIAGERFQKPYRLTGLPDIDSDADWPAYLAAALDLDTGKENRIYFGEPISATYRAGLENAGFTVVIVARQPFSHEAPDHHRYPASSASDIRRLYREKGFYGQL